MVVAAHARYVHLKCAMASASLRRVDSIRKNFTTAQTKMRPGPLTRHLIVVSWRRSNLRVGDVLRAFAEFHRLGSSDCAARLRAAGSIDETALPTFPGVAPLRSGYRATSRCMGHSDAKCPRYPG